MQYFTEQALTQKEALERIRVKYGDNARVLSHRSIRLGGVLGLFTKEGVEVTGYITKEPLRKPLDMEEEKKKILAQVKGDSTLTRVLEEIRGIKEKIDSVSVGQGDETHPTIRKIEDLLADNEFSHAFIRDMAERLKRECSLDELSDYAAVEARVVEWIGEAISIHHEPDEKALRVVILVGPTGVGKTTTIAKLAAMHGLGTNGTKAKQVRMLTIDNYRIGAKKQIETYGEIMGIPVSCVETYEDLKKRILLYQDADLILIDTIGKSPKDYMKLAEMRELLDACGTKSEVYLTLSATTKISDIREILQQFEPFRYKAIVLTKLDETMKIGNVVSVLAERQKPIVYITDGQVVPQDIQAAQVVRLLMNLDGFSIRRGDIERRFGGMRMKTPVEVGGLSALEQRGLTGRDIL
jgi:flagellar biosynthesis protein FlhF